MNERQPRLSREQGYELRIFIALCEAGWRGSPCWHIVDWMSYRLRMKYPLIPLRDRIINFDGTTS